MKKTKKCILNINSKKYIYALFLPISCMFIHFFQEIIFRSSDNYKILKYNLPLLFYYFLPKLLSCIFIPIIKSKNKGESIIEEQNKVLRRYHFLIKTKDRYKILILIYFISLLEVIYKADDSLLYYLYKIKKINLLIEKRTGFIIFVPLFCYLILHKKLYRHHLFALILTLSGAVLIIITRICLGISRFDDYAFHLINIFFSSFFSLSLVLIKYVFIKYLIISPLLFLFYDGIFCIINSFICVLLEYRFVISINDKEYIKDNNDVNNNYFSNNFSEIIYIFKEQNFMFYLSFFISFIASFSYFICNVLTIYHFGPYLNVLTDFLTPFLFNILYFCFIERNINGFIFEIIGFVIVIFGALVLNEIIIFNCLGLNENTYTNISRRSILEYMEELNPHPDNDNDNDDNDNGNDNDNETDNDVDNDMIILRYLK